MSHVTARGGEVALHGGRGLFEGGVYDGRRVRDSARLVSHASATSARQDRVRSRNSGPAWSEHDELGRGLRGGVGGVGHAPRRGGADGRVASRSSNCAISALRPDWETTTISVSAASRGPGLRVHEFGGWDDRAA